MVIATYPQYSHGFSEPSPIASRPSKTRRASDQNPSVSGTCSGAPLQRTAAPSTATPPAGLPTFCGLRHTQRPQACALSKIGCASSKQLEMKKISALISDRGMTRSVRSPIMLRKPANCNSRRGKALSRRSIPIATVTEIAPWRVVATLDGLPSYHAETSNCSLSNLLIDIVRQCQRLIVRWSAGTRV